MAQRWLLLLYRLPREPSAPRVAAWRALKRMEGGAYIQDGAFLLRSTPLDRQSLEDLAHDIRNDGGEASVVETGDVDDEKHLLSRLRAATQPEEAAPAAAKKKPRLRQGKGQVSRAGSRRR